MKLGDSINTYDPTVELKGQAGTFRVTTPGGEKLYLRCEIGEPPTIIGWNEPGVYGTNRVFLLTKMSEPVNTAGNEHITPFVRQATG
jgi:hypothetical protein